MRSPSLTIPYTIWCPGPSSPTAKRARVMRAASAMPTPWAKP